ncbi:MAG: hypothetical protein WKG06_11385 [Segetibacter sp.]
MEELTDTEAAYVLNNMAPDDRTTLFSDLPGIRVTHFMSILSREERKEAQDLIGYPENSVGRLMNTRFICLSPNMTVGDAQALVLKKE